METINVDNQKNEQNLSTTENQTLETMVSLDLSIDETSLLDKMANSKNCNINKLVSQIIKEKLAETQSQPNIFDKRGITLEKVTIDLPKRVVDFFRLKCHLQNISTDYVETMIVIEIGNSLKTQFEGSTKTDWTQFFDLQEAFDSFSLRENLMLK